MAHRVKIKENEKRDKYLDLARELKKLEDTKVTVIPIIMGALGRVSKGLVRGLEELKIRRRAKTIQITALLKSTRILRKVLDIWEDSLSLKLQWKTIFVLPPNKNLVFKNLKVNK